MEESLVVDINCTLAVAVTYQLTYLVASHDKL